MNASPKIIREHFTARLTLAEQPSVVEELQQRAEAAGRSVSDEVRAALRAYLDGVRG
jgi:plasmid stability protein